MPDYGSSAKVSNSLISKVLRPWPLAVSGILLMLGLAPLSAPAALNFQHLGIYPAEDARAHAVATADFDGDGIADVAMANRAQTVIVWRGQADGTFGISRRFDSGTVYDVSPEMPNGIVAADFNGDGKADLATSNQSSGNVGIMLGTGTGTFGSMTTFPAATQSRNLAIGDFNSDGKMDLALAGTGSAAVLMGNGDGTFRAPVPVSVTGNLVDVAVSDFNGDSKMDLVMSQFDGTSLLVLLGTGTGSFSPAVPYSVPAEPSTIRVADFNGDGYADLAAASNNGKISVLAGTGNGTFGSATIYTVNIVPAGKTVGMLLQGLATGDFNNDGKVDLVSAQEKALEVAVLLGDGNGSFSAPLYFPPSYGRPEDNNQVLGAGAITADFNGDGRTDLGIVRNNWNAVNANFEVLLQSPSAPNAIFTTGTTTAVATAVNGAAFGDFNRDSKLDVVVAKGGANSIGISLGDGAGNLGSMADYPAGNDGESVCVADFNTDGDLDVASSNATGVALQLGDGAGSLGSASPFLAGLNPEGVASADFNRDGKMDLAVANAGSNDVSMLIGDGAGSFAAATSLAVENGPRAVVVGDFNTDGNVDVASCNSSSNSVSLLYGNGAGSFGVAANFAVGSTPYSIVAGDVNRDGRLDLAVANSGSNSISVLLGHSNGNFSAAVAYSVGATPSSLAISDFNKDGNLDLQVSNSGSGDMSFLAGIGTGTFDPQTTAPVGSGADFIAAGDLDHDGDQDALVAYGPAYNLALLENGLIPSSAGFRKVSTYTTPEGPTAVATGDLNNDGKVDIVATNHRPSFDATYVSVRLGTGAGTFGTITTYETARSEAVALGDFDGDGNLDIAVGARLGAVFVHPGNGMGSFGAPLFISTVSSGECNSLTVGDLNRDSIADIVACNTSGDQVSVILGTPSFNLSVVNYPSSEGNDRIQCAGIGDLNHDGLADIITGNAANDSVNVLLGTGNGAFGAPAVYYIPVRPRSVVVADVDGDGKNDVVVGGGGLYVMPGFGDGTLPGMDFETGGNVLPRNAVAGAHGVGMATSDYNGDGKIDVALALNTGGVALVLGTGSATLGESFAPHTYYPAGASRSVFTATADFNGDGKPDLATANNLSKDLSILKNIGGQFALDTTSVAPSSMAADTTTSLLKIVAKHSGKTSASLEQFTSLHLGFTDDAGTTLSSTQANARIAALSFWKDNGDSVFSPADDTLVIRYTHLELDWKGRLHIPLPDTVDLQLAPGIAKTFFVAAEKSPIATSADTVKVTHVTSASSRGLDLFSGNVLTLESGPDVSSSAVTLPVALSLFELE